MTMERFQRAEHRLCIDIDDVMIATRRSGARADGRTVAESMADVLLILRGISTMTRFKLRRLCGNWNPNRHSDALQDGGDQEELETADVSERNGCKRVIPH